MPWQGRCGLDLMKSKNVICIVCDSQYSIELPRCPTCECPQQEETVTLFSLEGVSISRDLYLALWTRAQAAHCSVSVCVAEAVELYISSFVPKKKP